MVLLVSDITSIRLAVKLAMYMTPRASSKAISEAEPPIGTTRPKVPASSDPLAINATANATIQDLRITSLSALQISKSNLTRPQQAGLTSKTPARNAAPSLDAAAPLT